MRGDEGGGGDERGGDDEGVGTHLAFVDQI